MHVRLIHDPKRSLSEAQLIAGTFAKELHGKMTRDEIWVDDPDRFLLKLRAGEHVSIVLFVSGLGYSTGYSTYTTRDG